MIKILMISAKLASLALLKTKIMTWRLWNKVYNVIRSIQDVTNKILLRSWRYTVNAVMWPKFGNSSILKKEAIIASIF